MAGHDHHTPGAYANHLAHINQTQAVLATEDIFNHNGLLLIRKGSPLNLKIAQKLLNHTLVKPLETSVHVHDACGSPKLYEDIHKMLQRFPECLAIHQARDLDPLLAIQCQGYGTQGLLVQKITVLSLQLPQEYEKALFCAWFCLSLAQQMRLSPEETEAAFLAGLMHDTGMLHLDPLLLDKGGEFTAEQWRAVQSHAVIAYHFLALVPGVSELTRRAVREHHERCDGSGYPQGLFESQLCAIGQMVAMSDSLYAIRRKGRGGQALTLGEITPILQLNSTIHTYNVYAATMGVFRAAQLAGPGAVATSQLRVYGARLVQQRQMLAHWFAALQPLLHSLDSTSPHPPVRTARLMLERLDSIVVGSGLLNEALGRWFEHVIRQQLEGAGAELAEVTLMYQELAWQMRQAARVLELIIKDSLALPAPNRQSIEQALAQLPSL